MPPVSRAKYRKAARIYVSEGCSQARALFKAKVYAKMETAETKAWLVFRDNDTLKDELKMLNDKVIEQVVLAKQEKLEASARISRLLATKIEDNLLGEGDIDNKTIDSFVKVGKRDDQLQGHSIMAETNPQDKADAALAGWMLEIHKENDEKRLDHSNFIKDAIEIDGEE